MKKYLPAIVVVLVIAVAAFAIRQFRTAQDTATLPSLSETAPSQPSDDGSEVESVLSPTPASTVSRATGISLTVSSPTNNTTTSSESISVKGKTVAGAEVFVNDVETRADASGNFSVTITLDEGENYILIVVNDALGNYSEKELTVIYAR
ncbi:hypothetical protein HZB58_02035 [Candidatus Gottesmanbacteria bacterium]|nr:hypothetical protein [Candidatus Gottesmanbacteria bacterium]